LIAQGLGATAITKALGIGRASVYKVLDDQEPLLGKERRSGTHST